MDKQGLSELFFANAFLFYSQRDRILADYRLYFCEVPQLFGAGYVNSSAFNGPVTLGMVVRWWYETPSSTMLMKPRFHLENFWKRRRKGLFLICGFSGSALSGKNSCIAVNSEGKSRWISVPEFSPLWHGLSDICRDSDEKRSLCTASYSMQEVLSVLKNSVNLGDGKPI